VKRRDRLEGAYREAFDAARDWAGMGREPDKGGLGAEVGDLEAERKSLSTSHNRDHPGR
jgi:hypothetical protein